MSNHRSRILFILFGGFSSLVICLLLVFLFFKIPHRQKNGTSSSYQYQEIGLSSLNFTSSFGYVTSRDMILKDDFISYKNDRFGSTILISNFGSSQYECSGSCICSPSGNCFRRKSSILTRPFSFLIAALSSSLAINMAKRVFEDQCHSKFSSDCEEVKVKVDQCVKKEEYEANMLEKEEWSYAHFECSGHCLPANIPSRLHSTYQAQERFFRDEGPCESFVTDGTVKVKREVTKYKRKYKLRGVFVEKVDKYNALGSIARNSFSKEYLVPFCREISRRTYRAIVKKRLVTRERNMCIGQRIFKENGKRAAHWNVRCLMSSQKLSSRRMKSYHEGVYYTNPKQVQE